MSPLTEGLTASTKLALVEGNIYSYVPFLKNNYIYPVDNLTAFLRITSKLSLATWTR
jgi:hypothetical protein